MDTHRMIDSMSALSDHTVSVSPKKSLKELNEERGERAAKVVEEGREEEGEQGGKVLRPALSVMDESSGQEEVRKRRKKKKMWKRATMEVSL